MKCFIILAYNSEILSKFAQEKINRDVALDDVVVTGTKVKLAYRGDTLVSGHFALYRPEGILQARLQREVV